MNAVRSLHDRDELRAFLAEASVLRQLACSSIGPFGSLKMLRTGVDGCFVTVTSASHRLFADATARTPFAQLLLQLSLAQRGRGGGDCGLLAIAIAAGLVVDGIALGVGRHALCSALESCVRICERALSDADDASDGEWPVFALMHFRETRLAHALVCSILAPKRAALLAPAELDHVSALVVAAFVQTFGAADGAGGASGASQCVRSAPVLGAPPLSSYLVDGVLMDARLPTDGPQALPTGARVALFDIVLDGSPPADDETAREYGAEGAGAVGVEEEGVGLVLDAFVAWMARERVGLVASQKVISARLQSLLARAAILSLERLSLRHIDAVRRVSGARVQSAISAAALDAAALGAIGELGTRRVGRHALTLMTPAEPADAADRAGWGARVRPVVTIALCGRTQGALDELSAAIMTAHNTLALAARDPRVCPGGGATEWLLARRVRREAARWRRERAHPLGLGATPRDAQAGCELFASVLEAVPLAMARALSGADGTDEASAALGRAYEPRAVAGDDDDGTRPDSFGYVGVSAAARGLACVMRARHVHEGDADSDESGSESERGGAFEVADAVVIDLVATKLQAIASAVSVACVLLKVDQAIHAG